MKRILPKLLIDHPYPRNELSRQVGQALRSQREHGLVASLAIPQQGLDVDTQALGPEGLEQDHTPAHEARGPAVVPPALMVQAHADLEHTLVEVADRVGLGPPEGFQGLVTGKKAAGVELLNAGEEVRRGRLATTRRREAPADLGDVRLAPGLMDTLGLLRHDASWGAPQ